VEFLTFMTLYKYKEVLILILLLIINHSKQTMMNLLHEEITEKILKAYYKVYNTLGFGFLEKVYENAMMIELKKMELEALRQHPIKVHYEKQLVGDYFADIIVVKKVIIELKAVTKIAPEHEIQLKNYLKATDIEVGLLLNFGPEPTFKRKVLENRFK